MKTIQKVRCPNCGRPAERHLIRQHHLLRTQCNSCDYLLVTCADTCRVKEAYAPGILS